MPAARGSWVWRLWRVTAAVQVLTLFFFLILQTYSSFSFLTQIGLSLALGGLLLYAALIGVTAPVFRLTRTLASTVSSYNDRDYSFSVHWPHEDEFRALVEAHNELVSAIRAQNLHLVQRELMLDLIVQQSPVITLLVDARGHIVFANHAARKAYAEGARLEGRSLAELAQRHPLLQRAAAEPEGGLLSSAEDADADAELYHVLQQKLVLNGQALRLILLRQLTAELRRQEVETWKKIIRVISHEINNSLGPIASLARSGQALLERSRPEHSDAAPISRLPEVLQTIADRASHLEQFLGAYAKIARLPLPQLQDTAWATLIKPLQSQIPFQLAGDFPTETVRLDPLQIEQVLINLLKNAHESGSDPLAVELSVTRQENNFLIEVKDRGCGMSEQVASQALLPFYSTKRHGSGIGLALTREIVDAHGGRLSLRNREAGGLVVCVELPRTAAN